MRRLAVDSQQKAHAVLEPITTFLREGDKTDVFIAFNDFTIVCVACYAESKSRHSTA